LEIRKIFVLAITAAWLLWIWIYEFLLGDTALWKCLLLTFLLPVPALVLITALEARRRWRRS
jgi:hypothetical protein